MRFKNRLFNIKSNYNLPGDLAWLEYIPYDLENLDHLADRVKSAAHLQIMQRTA